MATPPHTLETPIWLARWQGRTAKRLQGRWGFELHETRYLVWPGCWAIMNWHPTRNQASGNPVA